MKDRNDPRDVRPRIGSPLGVYLASVTAAGLAALVAAVASVPVAGLLHLLAEPLFWAVAGLALLAEIRPIVAPGKPTPTTARPRSPSASPPSCTGASP
jgi:hypothetical protein